MHFNAIDRKHVLICLYLYLVKAESTQSANIDKIHMALWELF